MTDEFVVLLAPLGFGYGLGSMPILLRAVGDRHIAWCLGLAAATALMGYAMANGGAIRLIVGRRRWVCWQVAEWRFCICDAGSSSAAAPRVPGAKAR